ncbi:M20 family metallopeptidase [Ferdinandcohnia sp. SAFN-114]|uniref:M20 family metallopeptidase n=1 Tax=Ferdinandcohnia sp. SAFN-114 TaxID=3387275 RepID=UPI003F80313B
MREFEELETHITTLLSEMVSIPSVNPGEGTVDNIRGEERMASYLFNYFKHHSYSFNVKKEEILTDRPNIYIETSNDPNKKTLLFETHTDTVSVDHMSISPFEPFIKDGKFYGRGSCDAKGQLVAMISGIEMALEENDGVLPINVKLAATVDEEHLHRGVDRLVELGIKADGAVAGEPTELKIVSATKGSIRFKIRTTGKSAHTANPQDGINAIYIMSDVIQVIQKKIVPLLQNRNHPLCGNATTSVTIIGGGSQVNIVPDECVIDVDRRLLPGEQWEEAYQEIQDMIMDNLDQDLHSAIIFDYPYLIDPSLETSQASSIVSAFSAMMQSHNEDLILCQENRHRFFYRAFAW